MSNQRSVSKILVIKLRKLGDVINTTPSVRALHMAYPHAEIIFLTEPLGAKIYEFSPYVSQTWIFKSGTTLAEFYDLSRKVRQYQFDIVVDFYQHLKTKLLTRLSGAPIRLGFTSSPQQQANFFYTNVQHISEKDCQTTYSAYHNLWLLEKLDLDTSDYQVEFPIDNEVSDYARAFCRQYGISKKTIAFCAQTERAVAQVSIDFLANIGDYLISQGYDLYFVYGPNERKMAELVYDQIEDKAKCLIGYEVPTIAQVRGILANCFMYVGNDGGNKHLAVTAGIPTLGLFWQDNPPLWTPPEPEKHQFIQTDSKADLLAEFESKFQLLKGDPSAQSD